MERKHEMCKELADALCDRIKEDGLPIEVHLGEEVEDCHGDRQVDVLLVYEDEDLVRELIDDVINVTFNLI